MQCPLCTFVENNLEFLNYHVNVFHLDAQSNASNGTSPSEKEPSNSTSAFPVVNAEWVECSCGEICLLTEFPDHLDLHDLENTDHSSDSIAFLGTPSAPSGPIDTSSGQIQHCQTPADQQTVAYMSSLATPNYKASKFDVPASMLYCGTESFGSDEPRTVVQATISPAAETLIRDAMKSDKPVKSAIKLGRLELGPFHNEEQMPARIRYILEYGAKTTTEVKIGFDGRLLRMQRVANEMTGLIPVLAQCSAQDHDVSRANYCHPDVTDVFRLAGEGGFCGYRNIQNLLSYIRDAQAEGHKIFSERLPSVLQLQDMIERAWDRGFNEVGRIETGGIRGTRKFIGTPEAEALLRSYNIGCIAIAVPDAKDGETGKGKPGAAYTRLLKRVREYFQHGCTASHRKISRTSLGPLYFQHPGHSMTIVGFEERKDGSCNLVVFDPMYKPSPLISKLRGEKFRISYPARVLKAHRRGAEYLKRHQTFELLSLTARVPAKRGWQGS